MKLSQRLLALGAMAVLPAMLYLAACAKSSTTPTYSYNGPGSKWAASLNSDGTFTITYAPTVSAAVEMTVNGTYSRLSTGFVKLTVTSATGTGAPSAGDTAYGLEVPGFAFLLKPVGTDENVIPMVVSGGCPTADIAANWMIMEKSNTADATNSTQDWFGTFTYDVETNDASVATRYPLHSLSATNLGAGSTLDGASCSDGLMTISGGGGADMFLTQNGGAIVHANTSSETEDSFIVAFPTQQISDLTNLDGDYAGIYFNKDVAEGADGRIVPISVSFEASSASAATATGNRIEDVETGTLSTGSATLSITQVDSPSNGFLRGTITIDSSSGNIACTATTNMASTGKKALLCIGQSPTDTTKLFNFLAVSK